MSGDDNNVLLTLFPFLLLPDLLRQVTMMNSKMQLKTKIMQVSIQMSRKEM